MQRIKIEIEYIGKNYVGWQEQNGLASIQGTIQQALFKALNESIEIFGSGRTDAGVNAMGQVAHFDTNSTLTPQKIMFATNYYLPEDVKIKNVSVVDNNFHARHSAKSKTYVYKMYYSNYDSPFFCNTHAKLWHNIDVKAMQDACQYFVGTHDFCGFCEPNPQVFSTVRAIFSCKLEHKNNELLLYITGNAFLHKMVRIIAGTIIKVGEHKILAKDLPEIINSKNRQRAGHTAPAFALTLLQVDY